MWCDTDKKQYPEQRTDTTCYITVIIVIVVLNNLS